MLIDLMSSRDKVGRRCSVGISGLYYLPPCWVGLYPAPKGHSLLPGLEVAGTVVHSRSGAWSEGDKVCALTNGGGYAEFCAVPGGQVLPIPEGIDMKAAACIPESFFTVWHNVLQRGFDRIPEKSSAGL